MPRQSSLLLKIALAFPVILFYVNCSQFESQKAQENNQATDIDDPSLGLERRQCLEKPLVACSEAFPCTGKDGEIYTSPSRIPSCGRDGVAKSFLTSDGVQRYYCHYDAASADRIARPLIIFLHGGSGQVENLYNSTELRQKAETFQLSEGTPTGYHLVGLQSRNLQINLGRLFPGRHFDTFWWDFRSPSSNPEVRDLDQLIHEVVSQHRVDATRIYLIGWSEGGMLATYYGMARHKMPSPYGHKVAAVATYSSSSPFDRIMENDSRCEMDLDFETELPIYTVSRTCDVVACNKQQQDKLWSDGSFADVIDMESWVENLRVGLRNPNVTHRLINAQGSAANTCQAASQCSLTTGTLNHLTWPRTVEIDYLNFLKGHVSVQDQPQVDLSFCHQVQKVSGGNLCVIKPSETDPNIKEVYSTATLQDRRLGFGYHVVGIPDSFSSQSQVHLHLTGSYGRPFNQDAINGSSILNQLFLEEGMRAGRVMIQLAYNNRFQVNGDICVQMPTLNNCAGLVRTEIITGQDLSSAVTTSRADSIENRLQKLMDYLQERSLLLSTQTLQWRQLEVSGHSQGSGHAYFLAKFYGVKRACLLGGPYDVADVVRPGSIDIADWYTAVDFQTPVNSLRALVHTGDDYYPKFKLAYEVIGLTLNRNYFETSLATMTNINGAPIDDGHPGIIMATQFSELRSQVCFE